VVGSYVEVMVGDYRDVPKSVLDPDYGMYFMELKCQACGAPRGVHYPATGIPQGTVLTPYAGDKGISSCLRCGKAKMEVVNRPPSEPLPKKPRGWRT